MTGLIIAGSITLFFAILLFSPVRIHVAYIDGEFRVIARYLFVKRTLFPLKPEKTVKKKAPKKRDKTEEPEAEAESPKKKKNFLKTARHLREMVRACKKAIDTLRHNIVFYKLSLVIITGGDEAKEIAVNYARIHALVQNGLSLLDSVFVVNKPQKVQVSPDFTREKTFVEFSFRVKLAPFYALAAAVEALFALLRIILSDRLKRHKHKRKKIKGGKKNEPTASCQ